MKSLEGIERKKKELLANNEIVAKTLDQPLAKEEEDDDDSEWYRKEVGENPDKGIISSCILFITSSMQSLVRIYS